MQVHFHFFIIILLTSLFLYIHNFILTGCLLGLCLTSRISALKCIQNFNFGTYILPEYQQFTLSAFQCTFYTVTNIRYSQFFKTALPIWEAGGNSFLFSFLIFMLLLMASIFVVSILGFFENVNCLFKSTASNPTQIFFSYQFGKLTFCHMIQMLSSNSLFLNFFCYQMLKNLTKKSIISL